jgi:hypothetical protein
MKKNLIIIFSIATLIIVSLVIGCKKETVFTEGFSKKPAPTEIERLYNQLIQPDF